MEDIEEELRTEKMYVPGTRDKNDAMIFVVNAKNHVPGAFDANDTLKLAFYLGELAISEYVNPIHEAHESHTHGFLSLIAQRHNAKVSRSSVTLTASAGVTMIVTFRKP